MWNKKYKGYLFKYICNKLEVAFKPHHKFAMELGGYAKMRIWRANDSARGHRMLRGRIIMMDGSTLYRRTVLNTK
jgi:hypothetical protein